MKQVVFDGSFGGLLTAIFEVYEYKIDQPSIIRESVFSTSLFGEVHRVISDEVKAKRVFVKLEEKLSKGALQQFYKTFLSELPGIDETLLRYIQYVLRSKYGVENDYSHPDVLAVQQTAKKVHREKHRMEAFVRFQLTADNLFYAVVQPDFDVLPLISTHFKNRYADQRWMIFDLRRQYGLYYDLEDVQEVSVNFSEDAAAPSPVVLHEQEELYKELWKNYFNSVNIKARKNTKLHIQHMPRRYWKFLVEKAPLR